MEFTDIYDYLAEARRKLFDWIRPLSQEQYTQEFPLGLRTLRRTMVEIACGEAIYGMRLRGLTPPPREQLPVSEERQQTFAGLETAWTRELEPQTRALLRDIRDWDAPIEYRVTRTRSLQPAGFAAPATPTPITIVLTTTKRDLATQMVFHEVHHRAQAMAMLRQLGVEAQDVDYSILRFQRREAPA